jgi:hypothetical protein
MSENTIQLSEVEKSAIRMALVGKINLIEKVIENLTIMAYFDLAEEYKEELQELEILKQKF